MAAPYGTRVSADGALVATKAASLARGTAWVARENLAEGLTAARDGLHETLAGRARERGLDRAWPGIFFRRTKTRVTPTEAPPPTGGEGGDE